MKQGIKHVNVKIIGIIFIDVALFFILVFASFMFFSIPTRAEKLVSLPANNTFNQTSALLAGITNTNVMDISSPEGKVFVCKYVGTPGVNEGLQTGDNPISVSTSAIPDYQGIGSWFADEQGRSYVLAEDVGQPEPPVSDCPPPDAPTPTTVSNPPTLTFTPTNTQPSQATATLPAPKTATPTYTATLPVSNTATPTHTVPPPSKTATPTPTRTVLPSPTSTATSRPRSTNTLVPSPTTKTSSASPNSTAFPESNTCATCSIAKDFRELIVGGLYSASLLNSQDISSSLKVSITLYDVYKGVIVGETIDMVDIQAPNKIMQVAIPLWCINPITEDVYWIRTEALAKKTTGEIWFATDEWVQINLSNK